VAALFPLWLQLKAFAGPAVIAQARQALESLCRLAKPFTIPAPQLVQSAPLPAVIPPTSGCDPSHSLNPSFCRGRHYHGGCLPSMPLDPHPSPS
jgi:hypothetical protein